LLRERCDWVGVGGEKGRGETRGQGDKERGDKARGDRARGKDAMAKSTQLPGNRNFTDLFQNRHFQNTLKYKLI
jgi:hypothetical protein